MSKCQLHVKMLENQNLNTTMQAVKQKTFHHWSSFTKYLYFPRYRTICANMCQITSKQFDKPWLVSLSGSGAHSLAMLLIFYEKHANSSQVAGALPIGGGANLYLGFCFCFRFFFHSGIGNTRVIRTKSSLLSHFLQVMAMLQWEPLLPDLEKELPQFLFWSFSHNRWLHWGNTFILLSNERFSCQRSHGPKQETWGLCLHCHLCTGPSPPHLQDKQTQKLWWKIMVWPGTAAHWIVWWNNLNSGAQCQSIQSELHLQHYCSVPGSHRVCLPVEQSWTRLPFQDLPAGWLRSSTHHPQELWTLQY